MNLPFLFVCWGLTGAAGVALFRVTRCPCPWWKLLVAFICGGLGGYLFYLLSGLKIATSIDFLASDVIAVSIAALAYCIVCPIGQEL